MTDADTTIEKLGVIDSRIVQSTPKYGITKGANSINSMPFMAQTESAAQHQYTIQVPNQGVYMDRALMWTSTVALKFDMTVPGGQSVAAGAPAVSFGDQVALASFPLHRLVSVINGTINNQNVTFNCDVLDEVLRLVDLRENRQRRTCPTMLDYTASYGQGALYNLNPLAGAETSTDASNRPNGSYADVFFTDTAGNKPAAGTVINAGQPNEYTFVNGLPTFTTAVAPAVGSSITTTFYLKFTSTEKFLLSPLIFSELCERDTGIFGLNNVLITLNMASPSVDGHVGRVLRAATSASRVFSNVGFNSGAKAFENSVINVQFLDPNWEVPLPTRSIVPYMDYSRYLTSVRRTLTSRIINNAIPTQTITLPYIPDLIVISARPATYGTGPLPGGSLLPWGLDAADYCFPIERISLQWANRSGLLSTHTPQQLYDMSYNNGLRMTYEEWTGIAKASTGNVAVPATQKDGSVPMCGGFLVLRPGIDFVLDPGQAPGMVGNFVIQAGVHLFNQFTSDYDGDIRLCIMAINSGFFATVYGTSAIMRGVLSASDVAAKSSAPPISDSSLTRLIGAGTGGGFFDKVNTAWNVAKDLLPAAQQAYGVYNKYKGGEMAGGAMVGGAYAGGGAGAGAGAGSLKRSRLLDRAGWDMQ